MRTVRHPITMFVVTVLAVIGIGVGVVAATTNQKVYGPPWGRFRVAFPGQVYVAQAHRKVLVPSGLPLDVTSFSYSNQPHPGWVAYAPLSGTFEPSVLQLVSVVARVPLTGNGSLQQIVRSIKTVFFRAGVSESVQDTNGLSITTIGPQCEGTLCTGAEVVSNGRVLWDVLAISEMEAVSKGPASTVEGFMASFQPIG
jgi:hypothetical protein